jgi:hypothetical protein
VPLCLCGENKRGENAACVIKRGLLALLLYLATATAIAFLWHRFVQRLAPAAAIVLLLLPLLFTGQAILTNRTLAPADIAFMAEPLHGHARDFGVETPHNPLLSDLHCQILPWQRAAFAEPRTLAALESVHSRRRHSRGGCAAGRV